MSMKDDEQFFHLGMGYYVACRFTAHARFDIITGNLCHHAIEMFLKGKLVQTMEREVLKNDLRHNLPKIWGKFKAEIGDESLDQFDETIRKLQEFEDIRYPDKLVDLGAQITITIGGPPGTGPATGPGANVPSYDLVLGDIDDLVRTIFDVCSFNSEPFIPFMQHNLLAHEYLEKSNARFGVSVKETGDV